MEDLVVRLEEIPLSGEDLTSMARNMGNPAVKYVNYDDLKNVSGVAELFGPCNSVYVLFQVRSESGIQAVGHWAGVMRNAHGISYYDPYGLLLSQDIHLTGEPPHLERILSGHKVDMNHTRDQKFRDHINTCGRHVVVRSLFHFMTNDEYNDLITQPILNHKLVRDLDVFVSILTAFVDSTDRALFEFFIRKVRRPGPSLAP